MTIQELLLRKSITIQTPVQRVWQVLTQLPYLAQWQYIPASTIDDTDLHAGSVMQWRDENDDIYLEGMVTTFEPHKMLVMDLRDTRWEQPLEQEQSVRLSRSKKKTAPQRSTSPLAILIKIQTARHGTRHFEIIPN